MKKEIQEIGASVIDLQIKALKKLKYSLNESFVNAVKALLKCKSKVIICGVGKSGIIASKISFWLSGRERDCRLIIQPPDVNWNHLLGSGMSHEDVLKLNLVLIGS